jgi:hypothetical protein
MKKLLLVFLCFFSFVLNAQSVDSLIPQNYPQVIKSESTGWNSSDFEPYLKKYTIMYGLPTYENTSNGAKMEWVWVGKKLVLTLKYIVKNSLAPAETRIELVEKANF